MSEPNKVIDRANNLLREHVIDCLYRLEKLELVYLKQEPGDRLPQLARPADIYQAMKDVQRRLEIVEAFSEQGE